MNLSFSRTGIQIDGRDLPRHATAAEMIDMLGTLVTSRSIPMHPKGERIANVSPNGVVWYLDLPENAASHFHVAIYACHTPENPPVDF